MASFIAHREHLRPYIVSVSRLWRPSSRAHGLSWSPHSSVPSPDEHSVSGCTVLFVAGLACPPEKSSGAAPLPQLPLRRLRARTRSTPQKLGDNGFNLPQFSRKRDEHRDREVRAPFDGDEVTEADAATAGKFLLGESAHLATRADRAAEVLASRTCQKTGTHLRLFALRCVNLAPGHDETGSDRCQRIRTLRFFRVGRLRYVSLL